eukprot:GILK01005295.1.p1 GENE.GILK01005295.1~~GILK01005295.1.p1  ORF type:complete len:233 (-),score=28.27 GILK01005295.1:277-975(-)
MTVARLSISLLLLLLPLCLAQQSPSVAISTQPAPSPLPDVVLNVPRLHVGKLQLVVKNLTAHVSLNARVGNLVKLNAGVNASLQYVNLTISDVNAQVYLGVKLDNLVKIVNTTLDTVDALPDILNAVNGLLGQLINSTTGNILQRIIDPLGSIIERTLDSTGAVLSTTVLGNVKNLFQLLTTVTQAQQVVSTFSDPLSGALVEVISSLDGSQILGTRVINPGSLLGGIDLPV